MTVLSCPYLFFSILRPGRTAEPIFTLCGSNEVFPRKDGPFGLRTMAEHIWGKYAQITPQKWAWIGNFQSKRQNVKKSQYLKNYKSDQNQIEDQAETGNCTSWEL